MISFKTKNNQMCPTCWPYAPLRIGRKLEMLRLGTANLSRLWAASRRRPNSGRFVRCVTGRFTWRRITRRTTQGAADEICLPGLLDISGDFMGFPTHEGTPKSSIQKRMFHEKPLYIGVPPRSRKAPVVSNTRWTAAGYALLGELHMASVTGWCPKSFAMLGFT